MLELRVISGGKALPIFDLPAALGRREAAKAVGGFIGEFIAFLDDLGGDPDLEDGGDLELSGDEADISWPEWQSRGRHKVTAIGAEMQTHSLAGWQMTDDDEQDDVGEEDDDDSAVDDRRCDAYEEDGI